MSASPLLSHAVRRLISIVSCRLRHRGPPAATHTEVPLATHTVWALIHAAAHCRTSLLWALVSEHVFLLLAHFPQLLELRPFSK
jgi:hypothetical protein